MKSKKHEHLQTMRGLFMLVFLLMLLILTSFSMEAVFSNGMQVEMESGYGIYYNGVFQDTASVLLPHPHAVQKEEIRVRNSEARARNLTISLSYSGSIVSTIPEAFINSTTISWQLYLAPFQHVKLYVIGKNFSTSNPSISFSAEQMPPQQPLEKKPITNNLSNTSQSQTQSFNYANKSQSNGSRAHIQTFSYVREQDVTNLLQAVFAEEKRLDLVAKSVIVVLAGLVILVVAGGFALLFGKKDVAPQQKKPRIHIEDMYNSSNFDDDNILFKYNYEESEYWK